MAISGVMRVNGEGLYTPPHDSGLRSFSFISILSSMFKALLWRCLS